MAGEGRCAKCGSEDRIPDVLVHGGFHTRSLMVEIVEKAKSWFSNVKDGHQGVLTATICGRCGLTELYVKNPEELLEAYRQKQPPV